MELQAMIEKVNELFEKESSRHEEWEKATKEARDFCEENLVGKFFMTQKKEPIRGEGPHYFAVTGIVKHDMYFSIADIEVSIENICECDDFGVYIVEHGNHSDWGELPYLDEGDYYDVKEITREEFMQFMQKAQQTLIDRIDNAVNKKENHGTRED